MKSDSKSSTGKKTQPTPNNDCSPTIQSSLHKKKYLMHLIISLIVFYIKWSSHQMVLTPRIYKIEHCYLHSQYIRINKQTQFRKKKCRLVVSKFVKLSVELIKSCEINLCLKKELKQFSTLWGLIFIFKRAWGVEWHGERVVIFWPIYEVGVLEVAPSGHFLGLI